MSGVKLLIHSQTVQPYSAAIEFWEWISNIIPHSIGYMIIYPLKLNHASKKGSKVCADSVDNNISVVKFEQSVSRRFEN